MPKYVIKFTKEGYLTYTSHLDMLRLFKRAFKKCEIVMAYSQGFNPHPKMGFAQPLSLGYKSRCELLEVETAEVYTPQEIEKRLQGVMPEGVEILSCTAGPQSAKSLAAATVAAEYRVCFPVKREEVHQRLLQAYLAQDEILTEKRQKKTKKMVTVDIRAKIRAMQLEPCEHLTLSMLLDCGSSSNLSPEQVISSFLAFAELEIPRYEIEVERKGIFFEEEAIR